MNDPSFQETSNLFDTESSKLENLIGNASKKSEKFFVEEIIELYYQIINVTSLIKFFKQSPEFGKNDSEDLEKKMENIEKRITNDFNSSLHPLMRSQLAEDIKDSMNNLKSAKKGAHGEKSKKSIEQESKLYEKLRQIMSTKEFVDQYHKGLDDD